MGGGHGGGEEWDGQVSGGGDDEGEVQGGRSEEPAAGGGGGGGSGSWVGWEDVGEEEEGEASPWAYEVEIKHSWLVFPCMHSGQSYIHGKIIYIYIYTIIS